MSVAVFNNLSTGALISELLKCCHSENWASRVAQKRPFVDEASLWCAVDDAFKGMTKEDWMEAFQAHPKIGDVSSLRKKFDATREASQEEQNGVNTASADQIESLHRMNLKYEATHGFIFIICATGKSIEEFLNAIESRVGNSTKEEIRNAGIEQGKITKLRLNALKEELMSKL